MINKLTKAQENRIIKVRDEWINRLDSCKLRTNQKKATKAINWLYKLAGYKKPQIVFLSSPFAVQLACNFAKHMKIDKGHQVRNQISDQFWSQIKSQVCSQVRNQISDQVWSQVDNQVRSQVDNQVRSQVSYQADNNNMEFFGFCYYGSILDYGWVSFYEYFKKLKGLQLEKKTLNNFNNFIFLLKSGIYDMVQFEKIVFVSDMPTKITRNNQNRLHNETGTAIEWSDGFGLYFLNGVSFDKNFFEKVTNPKVKMSDIFAIDNIEQRRVAYDIQDKRKMLELPNYKVVSEVKDDGYGNPMKIIEFTVDGFDDPFKYVNWFCPSTKREYFHEISGTDITDCFEAKNNSFRLPEGITFGKEF